MLGVRKQRQVVWCGRRHLRRKWRCHREYYATLAPNVFGDRTSDRHFCGILDDWLNQSRDFIVYKHLHVHGSTISGTQHLYVLTLRILADAFFRNIADRRFSVEGRGFVAGVRSPLVNLSALTLRLRFDSGQCCCVWVTCVSVYLDLDGLVRDT